MTELVLYTNRSAGLNPGELARLTIGKANPGAPLCVECRRPAHISIDGEDQCASCLGLLRRNLDEARRRSAELEDHLRRNNLPFP